MRKARTRDCVRWCRLETLIDDCDASFNAWTTEADCIKDTHVCAHSLLSSGNLIFCILHSNCRGDIRAVGCKIGNSRQTKSSFKVQKQVFDVVGSFSTRSPARLASLERPKEKDCGSVIQKAMEQTRRISSSPAQEKGNFSATYFCVRTCGVERDDEYLLTLKSSGRFLYQFSSCVRFSLMNAPA